MVKRYGTDTIECPADGPAFARGDDVLDLVGAALGHGVDLVVIPASRLAPEFFALRTGVAGEIAQKFANYHLRLAVVGDISGYVAGSARFGEFVAETNRGRELWFLPSDADLDARLAPA